MTATPGDLQLVTMKMAGRSYGLPITTVHEVLPMVALTAVPESPDWMAGVMDLRGVVLPVIDLRKRLELPSADIGLRTPIVVADHGSRAIGLIVDEVDDVITVPGEAFERPGDVVGSPLVAGLVMHEQRLIVVLDLTPLHAATVRVLDRGTDPAEPARA